MKNSSAMGLAAAGLPLILVTGCAQESLVLSVPTATRATSAAGSTSVPQAPGRAVATPSLSASPPAPGQAADSPLRAITIPLGKNNGVEARLPINGYFAAPGMEVTFDASSSVGAIDTYQWDLDGDGTYDATTAGPVFKHTYSHEFDGEMILRVSNLVGSSHVLKTPVHVSTAPYHQPLAAPGNVQAEVLSTVEGVSVIRVTWESNDPAAGSWAIAINGFPVGRIEQSARSVTVTEIERKEDVLVEVFGVTKDLAVGLRSGTTLPAAP